MKIRQLKWTVLIVITVLLLTSFSAFAAGPSPFVGHWQGIDTDGSDIRLTIGGPPKGPFQITWTESYFSICSGEAGIARGIGFLDEEDEYLLSSHLYGECLTTGSEFDFEITWQFLHDNNVLTDGGITWYRPGDPRLSPQSRIAVYLVDNFVIGWDWPRGAKVRLTINDPTNGPSTDYVDTTEVIPTPFSEEVWWARFDLAGIYEFKPGDVVTLSSRGFSKEHVVLPLTVEGVDSTSDFAYGEAEPGAEVYVHPWDDLFDPVIADGDGKWSMSFTGLYDLIAGIGGISEVFDDDNDSTAIDWVLMSLRVNYGHDWVESFYPSGYSIQIIVTGSDGNEKGRATVVTEPKWFWDGGTGFQTTPEDWDPGLPDIQPGDTVSGKVLGRDMVEQVRIGEISGEIDLETESISGTVLAEWFSEDLDIICDPWGLSDPSQSREDSVFPNGEDKYLCSWTGDLDILKGQELGVWYYGLDGHAVVNAFSTPNTRFTVWPEWNYLEGYEWEEGVPVTIQVEGKGECESFATPSYPEWDPGNTFFSLYFPESCQIEIHNVVTISSEAQSFYHEVQSLAITTVDMDADTVAGTALFDPEQYMLHGWIHDIEESYLQLTAEGGAWLADFGSIGQDLQPGMVGRVEIVDSKSNATAVEWKTPPAMGLRVNYGHDWVESFYEEGHVVHIQVTDSKGKGKGTATAFTEPNDDWGGEPGFSTLDLGWDGDIPDLQPGDWVYAEVDNGVTAQVQVGDVQGEVFVGEDRIEGTIDAEWISDPVQVECLDWGSGLEDPINKEFGQLNANGTDIYECSWDPDNEWDIQPWQDIGVGYSTPDGHWVANAFRGEHWAAVWTHDLLEGSWAEGEHSYYFDYSYVLPDSGGGTSIERTVTVAASGGWDETPIYEGYALIGPWGDRQIMAWTGSACEAVSVLHPDQPMRLIWGWVNDYSMTYEEAQSHFSSFTVDAYWDGEEGGSAQLETTGELVEFYNREARWEYLCNFTDQP